jgi:hypothetical protein
VVSSVPMYLDLHVMTCCLVNANHGEVRGVLTVRQLAHTPSLPKCKYGNGDRDGSKDDCADSVGAPQGCLRG